MNTRQNPRELAVALMSRSRCSVQVGCVIADSRGVFAWGWNSSGPDGFGLCAERHAISRANKRRLNNATYYIAAKRRRHNGPVIAKPCPRCSEAIAAFGCKSIQWRDRTGEWIKS